MERERIETPTPDADGVIEYPWGGTYRRDPEQGWMSREPHQDEWFASWATEAAVLDHYHPAPPEPPRPFQRGDVEVIEEAAKALDLFDQLGQMLRAPDSPELTAALKQWCSTGEIQADLRRIASSLVSAAPAADDGEGNDDE